MVESFTHHVRALYVFALVFAFLVISLSSLSAEGAGVARMQALSYGCQARSPFVARPPPQPNLPKSAVAALSAAIQSDNFEPRCSEFEVPQATVTAAPTIASVKGLPPAQPAKARPPRQGRRIASDRYRAGGGSTHREYRHNDANATSSRIGIDGAQYSWAVGYQNYAKSRHVTGSWMLQQNEQPYIDYTYGATPAHSLGQLWAIERRGASCVSDIEIGWMVSREQYGDAQPHLFIYAWDCSAGMGYVGQSSIPWVQHSNVIAPNSVLSHNHALHVYGASLVDGNWWFYYDGQWVGYIPSTAWARFFPSTIKEVQAGGEVATPEYKTCTTMGNEGRYGDDRRAAMIGHVWYEHDGIKTSARLNSYNSDMRYTTGSWYQGQPGPRFRYGGPGWCSG